MKKILALLLLLLVSASVWADGMVIRPDSMPIYQQNQQAFINYENGKENLFVLVNLRDQLPTNQKTVWIFPLPAKPEEIEINNLKGFPVLAGKEIKKQAQENLYLLEGYMAITAATPLTIFILPFWMISTTTIGMAPNMATSQERGTALPGLTIFQHIDRYGIATEVIKADDVQRFKSYLKARGTNLSNDAEPFLEEYMGKDYSFIVSWISNVGTEQSDNANPDSYNNQYPYYGYNNQYPYYGYKNPIGVFIQFPTSDIYFPLKPTAYYGNNSFPVTINIAGFKEPEIYSNIREKTTIGHYNEKFLNHTIQEEETLKAIFNGTIPESLQYTRISINTSANYFTQDLSIPSGEAITPHVLDSINQTWLLWMLLIFFLLAYLAANLTNRLYLHQSLQPKELATLAITNFFTVFITGLALGLMKKQKFKVPEKESGFSKKAAFLLVYEGIFLGFAILLFVVTLLLFTVFK
jgi:hypothetical protein